MESFNILKIDGEESKEAEALVVREIPLTIYLNNEELATLLCSPFGLKELVIGFLHSAGLVSTALDIGKLTLDDKNWRCFVSLKKDLPASNLVFKRLYTSGCGRGIILYNAIDTLYKNFVIENDMKVDAAKISGLMNEFMNSSELFRKTGGVHSAGLADSDKIIYIYDDIGRHNALDKVVGKALMDGIELKDKMLLVSGRISSEIYHKIIKTGIPILVSRGAPTDQSVKLGKKSNLTLVGFARGKRMNIYSGKERIL